MIWYIPVFWITLCLMSTDGRGEEETGMSDGDTLYQNNGKPLFKMSNIRENDTGEWN